MMKDVIIKIDQNSMVYKQETVLGISYENLQGKIIFKFLGTFPKGIAYLEYERDTEKGYLQMNQVGEEYQLEIKSSLLKKEGRIYLQLRVTEDATPEGIPVFKSNKFYLEVKEAINATAEIPDEYPEWIDTANEKIKEMDNLNITTERVEDGVDIVLTDKKGNTTRTEVKDGAPGPVGPQGSPGAVKMQVVDTLPETGETDTIYLVKKDNPGEQNLYDEYVYTDTGWEHIGDTSVDLSNYYTKEETDEKLDGKQEVLPVYHAFRNDTPANLLPIFNAWLADYNRTGVMATFYMRYNTNEPTGKSFLKHVTVDGDNRNWFFDFSFTQGGIDAQLNQYVYQLTYDKTNNVFTNCTKLPHNSDALTPIYNFSKYAYFGKLALSTTNTHEYTPTADYHPATKKYVDDNVKTYTAGDNITISEDNVISVNMDGVTTLTDETIDLAVLKQGVYIVSASVKYIKAGSYSGKTFDIQLYTNHSKDRILLVGTSGTTYNVGYLFAGSTLVFLMGYTFGETWYYKISLTDLSNTATKKYVDDQVGNINTVLATLTTVSEVTK